MRDLSQRRTPASGPQLTMRDRTLLEWIARHGIVTPQQVRGRFFPTASQSAANRRLHKLKQLHLVRTDRTFWNRPHVVRLTEEGADYVDLGLRPAKLALSQVEHTVALVSLLEELGREYPDAQVITERELRADYLPVQLRRGREDKTARTPDGLLIFPDGKSVAIELDRTPKATSKYEELVRAYRGARFDAVWWYFPSTLVAKRVREVVRRMGADDFMDIRVREVQP